MKKETRQILKKRAVEMAKESGEKEPASTAGRYVTFMLAKETYGVGAGFVREVYPLKDYTPLPGVPSFIFGIINIRGQILPIVDLKKFFNLPEKGLGELNKVIILQNENMKFGILADTITGIQTIDDVDLQASVDTITGIGAEYLKGVTGDRIIILDPETLLSDRNIIVHEEVS